MSAETDTQKTEAELLADSLEEVKYPNAMGLLMTMREIQQKKPLDDLDILVIDEDGKPYY